MRPLTPKIWSVDMSILPDFSKWRDAVPDKWVAPQATPVHLERSGRRIPLRLGPVGSLNKTTKISEHLQTASFIVNEWTYFFPLHKMENTLDRLETRNGWGRSPSLPSSGDASSPIRYANVPRCRPVADLASGTTLFRGRPGKAQ